MRTTTIRQAQASYDNENDQLSCGCDRGFCDCDEYEGYADALDAFGDMLLGKSPCCNRG